MNNKDMAGKGRLKTAHQSEVKSLRGSNTDQEHDVAVEGVFSFHLSLPAE